MSIPASAIGSFTGRVREERDIALWLLAKERWEREIEQRLHLAQHKKYRKERHEYIQTLRWLHAEKVWILEQAVQLLTFEKGVELLRVLQRCR